MSRTGFDSGLQDRLAAVERELQALRHEYDDLRRAHERVVRSPGWQILRRIDVSLARIPFLQRVARGMAAWLAHGKLAIPRSGGWASVGHTTTEQEQLEVLRSSPFFDADWYRAQNADLPSSADPAEHFLRYGAREGRRGGPLFNTQAYLTNNPDAAVGAMNPLVHFHETGAREGRTGWTSGDLLSWQGPSIRDARSALERVWRKADEPSFLNRDRQVAIYVSSIGNFFFKELAELCALGMREAGYAVQVRTDRDAPPADGETALVMAPHEFYYLGQGIRLADHPGFVDSIPIGTEQWQTEWFARALPFMLRAKRMLDINLQSADAFVRLGKACRYLALGFSPDAEPYSRLKGDWRTKPILRWKHVDLDSLSPEIRPLNERPLDVLCVGALSARRSEIFAALAPALAPLNCFLHLTDSSGPLRSEEQVDSELFTLLARNSRVLLNVHHSEMSYFEWQRIVLYGVWQRAAVVSERCFDIPFLRSGEHYLSVGTAELGGTITTLLGAVAQGDGRAQRMVDAARDTLESSCLLRDCLTKI